MRPVTPDTRMEACPDVELLMRLLDDELDASLNEAFRAHVADCPVCADILRTMEARSTRVSAWLARHDPPAPELSEYRLGRPTRTPSLGARWAIAATVVLAVGVAAGPARAWLLSRFGFGDAPVAPISDVQAPAPTAATAFVPRSGTVTLTFDAGVTGRTLAVGRSADTLASLDATPSRTEVVVGPDRFDVHDARGPATAYRLVVPATVTTVRVRVDGVEDVVVRPEAEVRVVAIPEGKG